MQMWLFLLHNTTHQYQGEGSPYLACNDRNAFFTSEKTKKYHAWFCQNECDALTFSLDNIFIRFVTKLYRKVVGIPMSTNFCFVMKVDFMMYLSVIRRLILLILLTLHPDIWTIF